MLPAELTDGREGDVVVEEPNHTTARKPGPLCVIQYSLGEGFAIKLRLRYNYMNERTPGWREQKLEKMMNKVSQQITYYFFFMVKTFLRYC
jgi:hypothetical protein